ncbi:hypothetical protein OKW41_003785 [Paraburkholderia sp. UCT70]
MRESVSRVAQRLLNEEDALECKKNFALDVAKMQRAASLALPVWA